MIKTKSLSIVSPLIQFKQIYQQIFTRFLFCCGLLVFSIIVKAQDCDCKDNIYVNETAPVHDVHKFQVNAATGTLTEVGSPWLDVGILDPHGLAVDLNGRLYIGQSDNWDPTGGHVLGPIRQLSCDGTIIELDFFAPNIDYSWNYGSHDGVLYMPSNETDEVIAYSLCDGTELGRMNIGADVYAWGFHVTDSYWYLADRIAHAIYVGEIDLSLFTNPATNSGTMAFSTGLPSANVFSGFSLCGITTDDVGNVYIVQNALSANLNPTINKYSPTGTLLATVSDNVDSGGNPTNGQSGFWGARGIVYSKLSDRIYVGNRENCVTAFDRDLNELIALNIGNPTGSPTKGVSIATECCPTNSTLTYTETVCSEGNGERIFLQDIFSCGAGSICEGQWMETANTSGGNIEYNDCDLSITVNGSGCATYTLEKITAATTTAPCAPFLITVNVCTEVPSGTVTPNQGTCNGSVANNDATIDISGGTNIDQANYSTGTTYTGAAYGDASNINVSSGSGSFTDLMPATTYTVRLFHGSNDCFLDQVVMTPPSECCPIITNPSAAQTTCEGQTITSLSINTDASSPDQIEFVYFTTQQSGNAMYSGGNSLGLVSSTANSASISNVGFPAAGVYYVYAILNPIPTGGDCRPFQEIPVTVNPIPNLTLNVSDPMICEGADAEVTISNSEIGINYQIRNDADDSPTGFPIAGNGGDIIITLTDLTQNTYTYNFLATNIITGCSGGLTDLATVTVNRCDFPDFPPPICPTPACHIIPIMPLVYFGSGVTADPPGNGDTNADSDVDDGIGFPNNIRRSIDIRIPITFYNNTGNPIYIQGWIDWNGDTNFNANEQVADLTIPFDGVSLTQTISQPVNVPADAVQDSNVAMRWRISTDATIIDEPCGSAVCAADGEVEDYLIRVECPEEACLPVNISVIRN